MEFKISLTFSKIMAFLILSVTTWYSLTYEDASVITLGIITSAGLLGWRQQKQKEIKNNEKHNS